MLTFARDAASLEPDPSTSDDLPGLVAQGRTVSETIEIARDVARKLIEAGGAGGVGWVERQR